MAKILVIDDDPLVRKTVVKILISAGHQVLEAAHGGTGMQILNSEQPELVITDIMMPQQEGIETIAQIREISGLPIIAISGSQRDDEFNPLLDAELMGADVAIPKPFTAETLLAAVAELLSADG